ncbi:MAG: alpha/beta fold hydrolase [Sedimentisphaerales bacterium]|nr:alpha/beta fold hydrolase [Sedimentisphaerales bacterium]
MLSVRRLVGPVAALALIAPAAVPAQSSDSALRRLEGTWLGTLKVSVTELRLVFKIEACADGSLEVTMDSPDQGATDLPVSRISLEQDRVTLELDKPRARYEGVLSEDGTTIDGKWMQSGITLPLVMRSVKEVPKPNRPQEPKKPYPYVEEEVTYRNTEDDVTLAATLTLPHTEGSFPAVILITGSGAQDRDETVFGHRPFLILADYLTRRGIAVLRADDRGVGGSTGNIVSATSEDFARDVLAGVAHLRGRKEIDPKHIGLIGHSEGGIIAPMVAARSADVSFIVLMAGTGVTGAQIIEGQITRLLKAAGAEPSVIDASLAAQRQVVDIARRETDVEVMKQKVREVMAQSVSRLDEKEKQALGYSDAYVDMQAAGVASPWFRFFLSYDPRPTLMKVRCPVLAVNGALDVQVWADENLPVIEDALKAGGNTDVTIRKLPGLNHLFQTASTGDIREYARIEETFAPTALETIAAWIDSQVGRP